MKNTAPPIPEFITELIKALRRRRFALGVDDIQALRQALRAGFGWSPDSLRRVCCALWATSSQEQETLTALFEEVLQEMEITWYLPLRNTSATAAPADDPTARSEPETKELPLRLRMKFERGADQSTQGLPPIKWDGVVFPARAFTFVPQFPLVYREIVQAWRRLRRPVREGAKTELDLDATVRLRSQAGVPTPVVLVPPRRNRSRLLLLVDRDGSMTPFQQFVDEVCRAIQQAGRLEQVLICYFHDAPLEGADEAALEPIAKHLFPPLDAVLAQIAPLQHGNLYRDPAMLHPLSITELLHNEARGADVAIISDGGAARKRYDLLRLLDTIAFLKALRPITHRIVWINPMPERYWRHKNNTAGQIARHVPMFPLDRYGLHQAVDVLHGRPFSVERAF